jgi:hypothetical protein
LGLEVSIERDHFHVRLGGDPASIYLDLGIAAAAPVGGLGDSVPLIALLREPLKTACRPTTNLTISSHSRTIWSRRFTVQMPYIRGRWEAASSRAARS